MADDLEDSHRTITNQGRGTHAQDPNSGASSDDGGTRNQCVSPSGRRRSSAQRGIDMLADIETKEVLNNIADRLGPEPSISVLVVGKTGVGKTTFINGLFENELEGEPPHTETVTPYELPILSPRRQRIIVKLTDTPGTEALTGIGKKVNRKKYLKDISESYRQADIVLYCLRMDDHVREDDVELMRFLLNQFGARLWSKVVVVLTFANRVGVEVSDGEPERKRQVYEDRLDRMGRKLKEAMRQAGISEELADNTSICVAGHPINKSLPECEDWACPFLVDCLRSGITDNAKLAILLSTWKRWATRKHSFYGAGTAVGVVTGLGLIVMGGVMSAATVTLPLGLPMIVIGASISVYSTGVGIQHVRNSSSIGKDIKVADKLQSLRPPQENPGE